MITDRQELSTMISMAAINAAAKSKANELVWAYRPLAHQLHLVSELQQMNARPDRKYNSLEELVLEHGFWRRGSRLPEDVPRGPMGECFTNALDLVVTDPRRYQYIEGFAMPSGPAGIIPFLHAWVWDTKTKQVVDPTWDEPEGAVYMGMAFETQFVLKTVARQGYAGILGNDYMLGSPLVRYGPIETRLPVPGFLLGVAGYDGYEEEDQ